MELKKDKKKQRKDEIDYTSLTVEELERTLAQQME